MQSNDYYIDGSNYISNWIRLNPVTTTSVTYIGPGTVYPGNWIYNGTTGQWEQPPEVVQWNGHTYLSPSPKLKMMCDAVRLI